MCDIQEEVQGAMHNDTNYADYYCIISGNLPFFLQGKNQKFANSERLATDVSIIKSQDPPIKHFPKTAYMNDSFDDFLFTI